MDFGIGIIGATGYIGVPYRKEIRESGESTSGESATIVALCARRQDRLQAAAAEDGADVATRDWREVVEHPDVNLVLVLTPDALHVEPAVAAAELGKHVFCEKPLGANLAEATLIRQAVRKTGVAHFVPFWTRYVPVFRRARELVQQGRLGDVRAFVYRWHNPRPVGMPFTWRDDADYSAAGSIADVGSHAYDILRFILGQEAKRVLAHAAVIMPAKRDLGEINLEEAIERGQGDSVSEGPRRQATAPDYAQVILEYANGRIGSISVSHASYVRKGFAPELELHGTAGSLSVDRVTDTLLWADRPAPATPLETVPEEANVNRFQQHVFPALRDRNAGEETIHPDIDDGWHVQSFTDAVVASTHSGGWVAVDQ